MSNIKKLLMAGGIDEVPRGESVYVVPGTYSWTCPDGVTSVSVVCIGAGGGGGSQDTGFDKSGGGGGGGLGYKNNYTVSPGSTYTVRVGDGGQGGFPPAGQEDQGKSTYMKGENGTDSYFVSTSVCKGGGGTGGTY